MRSEGRGGRLGEHFCRRFQDCAVDHDVPAVTHDRHSRGRSPQYVAMEVFRDGDDATDLHSLQARNRLLHAVGHARNPNGLRRVEIPLELPRHGTRIVVSDHDGDVVHRLGQVG
jgi:hypothetical protein